MAEIFEALDNLQDKGIYLSTIICIIFIFLSGLFFGVMYFALDATNTSFHAQDCVINNNTLVSSCQDLFNLALFPALALKELLIWTSFFFIFGLTISMLVLGYRSGSSPVMLGVMITFVGAITYLGILLSNVYRTFISVEAARLIMVPFTVYNKVMLNYPWFLFFVGLFAVLLGIVNYQKTSVNTPTGEVDY